MWQTNGPTQRLPRMLLRKSERRGLGGGGESRPNTVSSISRSGQVLETMKATMIRNTVQIDPSNVCGIVPQRVSQTYFSWIDLQDTTTRNGHAPCISLCQIARAQSWFSPP